MGTTYLEFGLIYPQKRDCVSKRVQKRKKHISCDIERFLYLYIVHVSAAKNKRVSFRVGTPPPKKKNTRHPQPRRSCTPGRCWRDVLYEIMSRAAVKGGVGGVRARPSQSRPLPPPEQGVFSDCEILDCVRRSNVYFRKHISGASGFNF